MITVVVGRPGMGKTAFLVGEIVRLARKHQVYTNIEVTFPAWDKRGKNVHRIDSLDDIVKLEHGKIVLDEVQTYLNSRNWDKLDIRFQLLLQQHRKRGLDIIGATQSIRRADVVFRELVQVFYEVRKIVTFKVAGNAFGLFLLSEYDPDSIESATRSYEPIGWTFPVLLDPYVFKVYDTTQEYKVRSPAGRIERHTFVNVEKTTVEKQLVQREILDTL